MSLDYPYYEELCRRRHRAAWWWRIGDFLYYLGLLPALIALPLAVVGLGYGLFGSGWSWLVLTAIMFPVGVLVYFIGASLKRHAYDLAERDGITSAEVYQRGTASQAPDSAPLSSPAVVSENETP